MFPDCCHETYSRIPNSMKNYGPVSVSPQVFKLLQRVVAEPWTCVYGGHGPVYREVMNLCIWRSWPCVYGGHGPVYMEVMDLCIWRSWPCVYRGHGPVYIEVMGLCIWRSWTCVYGGHGPVYMEVHGRSNSLFISVRTMYSRKS